MELCPVSVPRDVYIPHLGKPGPTAQLHKERLQLDPPSLSLDLNAPVRGVADVPAQAHTDRLPRREVAVTDALHPTVHNSAQPRQVLAIQVPAILVVRRGRTTNDGYASAP